MVGKAGYKGGDKKVGGMHCSQNSLKRWRPGSQGRRGGRMSERPGVCLEILLRGGSGKKNIVRGRENAASLKNCSESA